MLAGLRGQPGVLGGFEEVAPMGGRKLLVEVGVEDH
jgi:hypothetical protein